MAYINGKDKKILFTVNISGKPIEVSTEEEMNELLKTATVGSIYKYTGKSGIYEKNAFYTIEAVS